MEVLSFAKVTRDLDGYIILKKAGKNGLRVNSTTCRDKLLLSKIREHDIRCKSLAHVVEVLAHVVEVLVLIT